MTDHISQHTLAPVLGQMDTTGRQHVIGDGYIEFGASGAIDTDNTDMPGGWSVALTDTGVYTVTHPASVTMRVVPFLLDVSGGGNTVRGKTDSATTKIWQIWNAAGTAVAVPADGDGIEFIFSGRR
jgi:hypothetical protein